MVVAVRYSPTVKGRPPKLNMLELVSVANNRYKISKLRKRILPQGYCYVCSKIDPSGLFRNPNSHLYRKGFLHPCEHFPKPPDTTFVHDKHGFVGTTREVTTESMMAPSISVTIRSSTMKRDGTRGSSFSRSTARPNIDEERMFAKDSEGRLPSISSRKPNSQRIKPHLHSNTTVLKTHSESDPAPTVAKKDLVSGDSLAKEDGNKHAFTPLTDHVTVIPTGHDEERSIVTDLSAFTKGTTPSQSTNDLESRTPGRDAQQPSDKTALKPLSSLSSQHVNIPPMFVNQDDGLDNLYSIQPLMRETATLDASKMYSSQRPRAGHHRERLVQIHKRHAGSSTTSARSGRPESGHLRYHHRLEEDSVPGPGFEIPSTPSMGEQTLLDLRQQEERRRRGGVDGYGDGNDDVNNGIDASDGASIGMPYNDAGGISSDDASLGLSEKIRPSRQTGLSSSRARSFCRCATAVREISFTTNVCKACGKACYLSDGNSCSSASQRGDKGNGNRTASSTRQKMLFGNSSKMTRRSKAVTDEDYMDLNSIIHEGDGHYWSDEEFPGHFDDSPTSWYRYKHAKPYPLVDPDIHKLVYLKALEAARFKAMTKIEDPEFDETERFRRPNVFTYIPRLPYKGPNAIPQTNIGLRPDESAKPKKGQYMKHIFGDINPDDFYPQQQTCGGGRVIVQSYQSTERTDESSSDNTGSKSSKPAMNEPERSSVSLKMRRQN